MLGACAKADALPTGTLTLMTSAVDGVTGKAHAIAVAAGVVRLDET
jgi:hypothetical protein